MSTQPLETSPILAVYLLIAQDPLLAKQIHRRMREELGVALLYPTLAAGLAASPDDDL